MTPTEFQLQPTLPLASDEDEDLLPVTSYPCQWKRPKKRKESNLPISEAKFERHEYGKVQKRSVKQVSDFDPRPAAFSGSATERLPSLLSRGQGLCISLLLDPQMRYWTEGSLAASTSTPTQPTLSCLKETISAFKESLMISEEEIRRIEQDTRDRNSSQWVSNAAVSHHFFSVWHCSAT